MSEDTLAYCPKCPHKIPAHIPAIEVKKVSATYTRRADPVIRDISFQIAQGKKAALLGPNGAGKSTLLKTLVGILPASSGSISIFGHPVAQCQHQVSYLPQRSEIDWNFPISVYKLVLSGSYIHTGWFRKPKAEHHERTRSSLKLLGIEHVSDNLIGHLSVGQQQRVLLARSLVHNADLFILDEPFNAVDSETRDIIRTTFNSLQKSGKTILVTTHEYLHLEQDFDVAFFLSKDSKLQVKELHS